MKHSYLIAAGAFALGLTAYAATPAAAEEQPSTARVKVVDDPQAGQLKLAEVPSFDFKEVPALWIYNGFTTEATAATGDLQIIDGRPLDIPEGWTLTTALGSFKDADGNALAKSTLTFSTSDNATLALKGDVDTEGTKQSLASTGKRGTLIQAAETIDAVLKQDKTPDAKAKNGTTYTAELTWTLNADTEKAPSL